MPEAIIIDERDITVYPEPGVAKVTVGVTYRVGLAPPRTVWIDKEKYTPEAVKAAIKADQELVKEMKPRTITF